jgi:hypothetical protein
MEDNVTPRIKEPPVLYESTQSDVAKLARLFGGPVIAYWNNPRGAVCHNDVLALYSVLEKLGYHDTVYLFVKSGGGTGQVALRLVPGGLRAHRRQAVRSHRGCDQRAGACRAVAALQAGCRSRS